MEVSVPGAGRLAAVRAVRTSDGQVVAAAELARSAAVLRLPRGAYVLGAGQVLTRVRREDNGMSRPIVARAGKRRRVRIALRPSAGATAVAGRATARAAGVAPGTVVTVRGVTLHGPPGTGDLSLDSVVIGRLFNRWAAQGIRFVDSSDLVARARAREQELSDHGRTEVKVHYGPALQPSFVVEGDAAATPDGGVALTLRVRDAVSGAIVAEQTQLGGLDDLDDVIAVAAGTLAAPPARTPAPEPPAPAPRPAPRPKPPAPAPRPAPKTKPPAKPSCAPGAGTAGCATFQLRIDGNTLTGLDPTPGFSRNLAPGHGSVTVSPPGTAYRCTGAAAGCSWMTGRYRPGTQITLSAIADPGSYFGGWSGTTACPGSSTTCTVTADEARTVTALFGGIAYKLTVENGDPSLGTVLNSDRRDNVDCGARCAAYYRYGEKGELYAGRAMIVDGRTYVPVWQGCDEIDKKAGTSSCRYTMTADRRVSVSWTLSPS